MAISLNIDTNEVIGLEDYKEYVRSSIDPGDQDSVLASAVKLKALANNRLFLVERVNDELKNFRDFQLDNNHTAQTIMFGRVGAFSIRANIWTPSQKSGKAQELEDKLFSYMVPHDHNFDFLTVGYFGPGYETLIYEYDYSQVVGKIGEKIKMRLLERTQLDYGKIMLFRAGKDIHNQYHPKSLSISINLLVSSPEVPLREQFYFDLDKEEISGYVETNSSVRSMLIQLAEFVGDQNTCSILEILSKEHPNHRTRGSSLLALARLSPMDAESFWRRGLTDQHAYVKSMSKRELESLVL